MNANQKALRLFYENLIKLVREHRALHDSSAKFADLQYANHSSYDTKKIYSFIRFLEGDERLLFILNFDYENSHDIQVAIPEEVWTRIGLDLTKTYQLEDVFLDKTVQLQLRAHENLRLRLPNNQVYAFQIKDAV